MPLFSSTNYSPVRKHYFLLSILLLSGSFTAAGQVTYILSGDVTDEEKHLLPFGNAYLLRPADSTMVKFSEINDGHFSFDPLPQSDYLIKITAPGFSDVVQTVRLNKDIHLAVPLKGNGAKLNEVNITGSRKLFSNHNGNLRVNIEHSIFAAIPTPIDLLSKLPGVQVSPDGESISLIGKRQPLVYIDNQRASLSDLQSLSVSDISSIEIIKNPSSKYESEGRAVILISRKVNKKEGFKTDLSETVQFKRFFHNSSGFNTSYKKNRLELKANFQYNRFRQWEHIENNFRIDDRDIVLDGAAYSLGIRKQYIMGGSAYYQINDDDYISLSVNGRVHDDAFLNIGNSLQQDAGTETSAYTHNASEGHRPYFNTNFNYNKKFNKKKSQLFAGGQYANFTRDLTGAIANSYNSGNLALVQDRYQKYNVGVWTGRIDYEQQLKHDVKWETGVNATSANATSLLDIRNYDPSGAFRTDFLYDEQDYAAYTQLSGKVNRINYSAGLRAENTQVQGKYKDSTGLLVDRNYTQLFPKASIDIAFDSNRTLTFAYARSIARPNYANSNQITTYINPFFEWSNNINLLPSINDEVSVNFQYKEYSLQLLYIRIKDPEYYSAMYDEQEHKLRMINTNLSLEQGVTATLTLPVTYKQLTSTNIISAAFNKVTDAAAIAGKPKPYFYVYSGNQLKLPEDFTVMLNAWYLLKRYEGIFERSRLFQVDLAASKTYKKLTGTVSFNNIFRSLATTERFNINTVTAENVYYEDVRALSISLKYSLGKLHDSKFRNKDVNEGDRLR